MYTYNTMLTLHIYTYTYMYIYTGIYVHVYYVYVYKYIYIYFYILTDIVPYVYNKNMHIFTSTHISIAQHRGIK